MEKTQRRRKRSEQTTRTAQRTRRTQKNVKSDRKDSDAGPNESLLLPELTHTPDGKTYYYLERYPNLGETGLTFVAIREGNGPLEFHALADDDYDPFDDEDLGFVDDCNNPISYRRLCELGVGYKITKDGDYILPERDPVPSLFD